jgi:hypothetical protein
MTSLFNNQRLPKRFWEKVVIEQYGKWTNGEPCWLWEACKNKGGYGRYRQRLSHDLAYEILVHQAPIPKEMVIHHLCKIKNCCNPVHLEMKPHNQHASEHNLEPEQRANNIINGKLNLPYLLAANTRIRLELGYDPGGRATGIKLSKPCVATNQITGNIILFKSTVEAVKQLNLKPHSASDISKCCNNKPGNNPQHLTADGFTWKWA